MIIFLCFKFSAFAETIFRCLLVDQVLVWTFRIPCNYYCLSYWSNWYHKLYRWQLRVFIYLQNIYSNTIVLSPFSRENMLSGLTILWTRHCCSSLKIMKYSSAVIPTKQFQTIMLPLKYYRHVMVSDFIKRFFTQRRKSMFTAIIKRWLLVASVLLCVKTFY